MKTSIVSPPSEFDGSEVKPLLMSTPNRLARDWAAAPYGAWSVINSSEPPARTQSRTALHSAAVNAENDPPSWLSALAMIRMSHLASMSLVNFGKSTLAAQGRSVIFGFTSPAAP